MPGIIPMQAGSLVRWDPSDLGKIFGGKKDVQKFPYKPPITGFLKEVHGDAGVLSFITVDKTQDWIFVKLDELIPVGVPHAE